MTAPGGTPTLTAFDILVKAARFYSRWPILGFIGYPVLLGFVAFGFGLRTPQSQFREQRATIDSVRTLVETNRAATAHDLAVIRAHQDSTFIDGLEWRARMEGMINGMVRLACLQNSVRDLALAHVPCFETMGLAGRELLRGRANVPQSGAGPERP